MNISDIRFPIHNYSKPTPRAKARGRGEMQTTMNNMSTKTINLYGQMRNAGFRASEALRSAKIATQFAEHEDELVRLRAEPEFENYFQVYGEPEGYTRASGQRVTAEQEREEIERQIELYGCWIVISEWRASEDDEWQVADSIGMNTGYRNPLSPIENAYVPDLMRAALDALENAAIASAI